MSRLYSIVLRQDTEVEICEPFPDTGVGSTAKEHTKVSNPLPKPLCISIIFVQKNQEKAPSFLPKLRQGEETVLSQLSWHGRRGRGPSGSLAGAGREQATVTQSKAFPEAHRSEFCLPAQLRSCVSNVLYDLALDSVWKKEQKARCSHPNVLQSPFCTKCQKPKCRRCKSLPHRQV